jgi:hypothetical protein
MLGRSSFVVQRKDTRFRFGREELHISKIVSIHQYKIQADTRIKSYHFVFHTHTHLKYSLKHNID